MSAEAPVVEIEHLTKKYPLRGGGGRVGAGGGPVLTALDDVSLAIEPGEIFALLGPNGAGKTTLIGCVAGLIHPTSGRASVLGHDVMKDPTFTRRNVGLVPQEINFDPFFDVEEALTFQAGYFGVKLSEKRLTEILFALGLTDKRKTRSRALSGGMKRRLLIGKALVHQPKVLFLDEPTAGVDVELRRDLWSYVRTLRAAGTTIVLTTHYLEEAEELADRIAWIDKGKLLLVDRKEAVMARYGERTVRLVLSTPIYQEPDLLAARGAKLVDGGRALEFKQKLDEEVGVLIAEAMAAGLKVRDVETRRSGLEEIYVKVLRHDVGAVGAEEKAELAAEAAEAAREAAMIAEEAAAAGATEDSEDVDVAVDEPKGGA